MQPEDGWMTYIILFVPLNVHVPIENRCTSGMIENPQTQETEMFYLRILDNWSFLSIHWGISHFDGL